MLGSGAQFLLLPTPLIGGCLQLHQSRGWSLRPRSSSQKALVFTPGWGSGCRGGGLGKVWVLPLSQLWRRGSCLGKGCQKPQSASLTHGATVWEGQGNCGGLWARQKGERKGSVLVLMAPPGARSVLSWQKEERTAYCLDEQAGS